MYFAMLPALHDRYDAGWTTRHSDKLLQCAIERSVGPTSGDFVRKGYCAGGACGTAPCWKRGRWMPRSRKGEGQKG
jgi:hypothetical protein